MPIQARNQELIALRNGNRATEQLLQQLQQQEIDSPSDQMIVAYIQHLEREKRRLETQIGNLGNRDRQIPDHILKALRDANEELRIAVLDSRNRQQSYLAHFGGEEGLRTFRRKNVDHDPDRRIKAYLDRNPNIPDGVDNWLLDDDDI